ncbi:extracellular solute-binding protein [Actinocorallia sp. A-T 12471]|uniref:extracellular solute-binding protein n=1 Tax=Actinocorallia sp. A-T 12471 TaxID=3089813 RepID=UPI0029D27570|nr:extracellular solute-binding protein [Actinocorallia sp. A-T 12471]MDX6741627.1 extracellular solute-binding protein [Actinocorallia sp. A-T 12471]
MRKTVIDAWVSDLTFPGYMDRWHRLVAEFEARHPDLEVRLHGVGFFTGPAEIAEAIAAGRGPAIAEYYFYMAPVARDTLALDGSPRYTSVERAVGGRTEILGEPVVLGDVLPAMREQYTYRGDLTSMPSVGTTTLMYANTALLERAGLAELPETWDEVEAACAALGGVSPHALTWPNHGMLYQQVLATRGGLLCDADNGRAGRPEKVELASPQMLAFARWWKGLHDAGHHVSTGKIPDWEGNFRLFAEQDVALRVSSSNDVNYMAEAGKAGGFGVAAGRLPYDASLPYGGNTVAGTSLWLADGLPEAVREGALAFLQFVHNPVNAAERHKGTSFLPITRTACDLLAEEGWFAANPHHKAAVEQIDAYPARTGLTGTPPCRGALFGDFAGNQDVMTRAMADVLAGADPEERFTAATIEAQLLLDAYHADAADGGPSAPTSLRIEYFRDAEAYSGADLENVVQLSGAE